MSNPGIYFSAIFAGLFVFRAGKYFVGAWRNRQTHGRIISVWPGGSERYYRCRKLQVRVLPRSFLHHQLQQMLWT